MGETTDDAKRCLASEGREGAVPRNRRDGAGRGGTGRRHGDSLTFVLKSVSSSEMGTCSCAASSLEANAWPWRTKVGLWGHPKARGASTSENQWSGVSEDGRLASLAALNSTRHRSWSKATQTAKSLEKSMGSVGDRPDREISTLPGCGSRQAQLPSTLPSGPTGAAPHATSVCKPRARSRFRSRREPATSPVATVCPGRPRPTG